MSRVMLALVAVLVSGCVLRAPVPEATPPAAPAGPDAAEIRLIEAAERAERSLASLARALPAPDPAYGMPAPDSLPAALRRPITLDWSGPLETLAADLARRAGYRFVAGRAPARAGPSSWPFTRWRNLSSRCCAMRACVRAARAVLTVDAAGRDDHSRLVRARGGGGGRLMRSRVSGARVPVAAALLAAVLAIPAAAASAAEPPPGLAAVQAMAPKAGPEVPFAEEKRAAAVRLAALGFGSRAGLARRTWEIAALLERHAGRLSAIYRFGDLMLSEAGFSVLPAGGRGDARRVQAGTGGHTRRKRGARAEDRRAGAAVERGAPLARLAGPFLAGRRTACLRPVPARRRRGHALANPARRRLRAGGGARRRHLLRRPRPPQPELRGRDPLAPAPPGGHGHRPRHRDRAHGRLRPRAADARARRLGPGSPGRHASSSTPRAGRRPREAPDERPGPILVAGSRACLPCGAPG